jgi:hypothetical protein
LSSGRRGGEGERARIELLGSGADYAIHGDDPAAARAMMAEAQERAAAWLHERPDDPMRQTTAGLTALNTGNLYVTLQENAAAMAAWQQALPAARAANGRAGPLGRRLLYLLLLRLSQLSVEDRRLPEAREWFQKAIAETSVQRSEVERSADLAALFDRPDFQDLLVPGKGDKE